MAVLSRAEQDKSYLLQLRSPIETTIVKTQASLVVCSGMSIATIARCFLKVAQIDSSLLFSYAEILPAQKTFSVDDLF